MKETKFQILTETSRTETEFLDIKLNIHNDNYMPYRKSNYNTAYINGNLNHPNFLKFNVKKRIN